MTKLQINITLVSDRIADDEVWLSGSCDAAAALAPANNRPSVMFDCISLGGDQSACFAVWRGLLPEVLHRCGCVARRTAPQPAAVRPFLHELWEAQEPTVHPQAPSVRSAIRADDKKQGCEVFLAALGD